MLSLVTLGATVQASVGFGLALIAAPVLLLVHAPLIPGPLMAASLVLVVLVAHRDRTHIDLSGLAFAMVGRTVGTLLAAGFLLLASQALFDLAFGALVILGALLSGAGLHFRPNRRSAVLAGGLSGLMGTISSIGGPPMALLYQSSGAARLRGTLAGFFVLGTSLSVVALVAVGRFGSEEVVLSLFLTPPMVLGFALAAPLHNRLPETAVRPLVIVLSLGSGAVVIWRAIF